MYELKTNVAGMMRYVADMGALAILIYDSGLKQSIGNVNVPLKLYLNRNLRPEKSPVHTFIEVNDKFPITKAANSKQKIGEVQIRIEGIASYDKPLPVPQTEPQPAQPPPMDYMKIKEEMKQKLSQVKKRVRSSKQIMGMKQKEPLAEQYPEDDNESAATEQEVNEIIERGETLKARMLRSVHNQPAFDAAERVWTVLHGNAEEKQVLPSNTHVLDFEVDSIADSLSDVTIYRKTDVPRPCVEEGENVRSENFPLRADEKLVELNRVSFSLVALSIKSKEVQRRLLKRRAYILASLPVFERGSVKPREEELKAFFSLDKAKEVVELNRTHEYGTSISDENFGNLVNSKVVVYLMAELNNDNIFQTLGRGELDLQRVILAVNHKLDTIIQLTIQDSKKQKQPVRSKEKAVPEAVNLRVTLELSKEVNNERASLIPIRAIMDNTEAKGIALGLLLYIKIHNAQSVSQSAPLNLYVRYKNFLTGESISTPVAWGSSLFNHQMQYPIFLSSDIINRISNGLLVFEVWDKRDYLGTNQTDQLIGLSKVMLRSFSESLKSQVVPGTFTVQHILVNQYPFIVKDDYIPIISPKLGKAVGSLGLTVAIGTPTQVLLRKQGRSREWAGEKWWKSRDLQSWLEGREWCRRKSRLSLPRNRPRQLLNPKKEKK